MSLYPIILLFSCFFFANASEQVIKTYNPDDPVDIIKPTYNPNGPRKLVFPTFNPHNSPEYIRVRRFVDGSQRFDGQNIPQQKQPDWELKPQISRDDRGNTRGEVNIKKHGDNHDFEAGWGQNIRGPDKHSETWHAGGSIRW